MQTFLHQQCRHPSIQVPTAQSFNSLISSYAHPLFGFDAFNAAIFTWKYLYNATLTQKAYIHTQLLRLLHKFMQTSNKILVSNALLAIGIIRLGYQQKRIIRTPYSALLLATLLPAGFR